MWRERNAKAQMHQERFLGTRLGFGSPPFEISIWPCLKSLHTLLPAFRIWHMANSNAPADAENTE